MYMRTGGIQSSTPRWLPVLGTLLPGLLSPVLAQPLRKYELADLKALERGFIDLAEKVRPSVVAIRAYQARYVKESDSSAVRVPIGQGSGFVLEANGLIATNRHVVEGADLLEIILSNGDRHRATIRQGDVRSDLAVLKIEATSLVPVKLGDLSTVRVNQWAFAGGNPFGLANDDGNTSITYGVVSALGRDMTHRLKGDPDVHYYGNLIETSAAINPGCSGGPLFNLDGEVIGVVSAIETSTGVNQGHGFAIPMDANTRRILETLAAGREVRYGFLGIVVEDVDSPDMRQVSSARSFRGARITGVDPANGPAAASGLRPSDVIVEFNNVPVEGKDHLVRLVGFTPVDSEVTVVFQRRGVKHKATVRVGDRHELRQARLSVE